MRRPGPRRLDGALERAKRDAAPATVLAQVQACWPDVVGDALARAAVPVAERAGTLTVACESAVWAQELELLGSDLVERLNAALALVQAGPLRALRARVGPRPVQLGAR